MGKAKGWGMSCQVAGGCGLSCSLARTISCWSWGKESTIASTRSRLGPLEEEEEERKEEKGVHMKCPV